MLPYKNRLTKKEDYEVVYRKGKPFFCQKIVINILKNTSNKTRIGVLVGSKFSKKAVDRNRIKRQIREIMQKNLIKIKPGMDLVISLRKMEKKKIKSKELRDMLESGLLKGKLIK